MLTLSAAYKIEGLNIAVVVICRVNATYLCGYNWACRSMLYWIGILFILTIGIKVGLGTNFQLFANHWYKLAGQAPPRLRTLCQMLASPLRQNLLVREIFLCVDTWTSALFGMHVAVLGSGCFPHLDITV
eukprot:scaffold98050_cov20-Tisochrysis_lutea.AAC.2